MCSAARLPSMVGSVVAEYPKLNWISVPRLIAASGDPWEVDESLQSVDPGAISDLSRAFDKAGGCVGETFNEFTAAQNRFRASWYRGMGPHPINDSSDVQISTVGLTGQQLALPEIGLALAGIAADLAEAQRFSRSEIGALNSELRYIDALIDQALRHEQDISELEEGAISMTANTYGGVDALREDYSSKLAQASTKLRNDYEYDPVAIEDFDADGEPSIEQRGRGSIEWYGANQRAIDESIVANNAIGDETDSAAARLRDYATATGTDAISESGTLATERLDDFRMAGFTGWLPRDPLMGGDARDRAQYRLFKQRQLEQGFAGPPMTPDQATYELNRGEQYGRVKATQEAIAALRNIGMSSDGAWKAVSEFIHTGTEINGHATLSEHAFKAYAAQPPDARFADIATKLTPEDAATFSRFARRLGAAGDAIEFATAVADKANGGSWEDFGGSPGGIAGGVGAGLATAALVTAINPVAGALIVGGAAFAGGEVVDEVGKWVGRQFDPPKPAPGGASW